MKENGILIVLLASFLPGVAFTGTMGSVANTWSSVITLSAGPLWTDSGKDQTLFLEPDLEKTYTSTKKNQTLFDGELFLGIQRSIKPMVLGQIGVAVAAASKLTLNGDIWEDADPDFNDFYYQYKVNHAHVAVKGKLIADRGYFAQPYLSGSVGVGFNRASNFIIIPKIFEQLPGPSFTSHTNTTFTYTVGVGLQKAITEHFQAGIGYEFADWGKYNLGPAPEQTLNSSLSLSHVYTHQLQFSLSYVA